MKEARLARLEKVRRFRREVASGDVARAAKRSTEARRDAERCSRAFDEMVEAANVPGRLRTAGEWLEDRARLLSAMAEQREAVQASLRAERVHLRALDELRKARIEEEKMTFLREAQSGQRQKDGLRREAQRLDEVAQRRRGPVS